MISKEAQALLRAAGFKTLDKLTVCHWNADVLNPFAHATILIRALLRRIGCPMHLGLPVVRAFRLLEFSAFTPLRKALFRQAVRSATSRTALEFRRVEDPGRDFFSVPGNEPARGFYRSAEVVRWMLDYPWVTSGPTPATRRLRYWWFANYYDAFSYEVFDILDGSERRGWMVLSSSRNPWGNVVKVLDHAFFDDVSAAAAARFVLEWSSRAGASVVETPGAWAACFRPSLAIRLMLRVRRRLYLWHGTRDSPFSRAIDRLELRPTDGVSAFDSSL